MAVSSRQVQNRRDGNGVLTGKSGTVYDVNIKYNSPEGKKTYSKKGFATKKEATQHEAEMKAKLQNSAYIPAVSAQGKQTVKEYLEGWIEVHGKSNLRPSTAEGYRCNIKNHIIPYIGHVQLNQLSPAMIDNLFQQLLDKGLSNSSVRYVQRILSVAFEHARKYHYVETNPARDVITKLGKQGETPDPYTVEQVQHLMSNVIGTEWEMMVVLGGLYGLRRNEILGLRWQNVDMDKGTFAISEQLPFKVPVNATIITEMAPTKSNGRALPITDVTRLYFECQLALQAEQKKLLSMAGQPYYDNNLVVAKPNGVPFRADRVSNNWGRLLRELELPHIRFHDLRHTAATNMHQLTGDFYTVGEILGHTLKGIGMTLGISNSLEAVTARYVDVRLERKKEVLNAYHKAVFPEKPEPAKEKPAKQSKKKSSEMEL
ncbi:MAG: tyrosine-type recombinase/integrase [Oscillospiraceae bacterium]|jgi:integrase|nr:tyrosine-type recombinase/integrase [Oscillospiraceae bacterium]